MSLSKQFVSVGNKMVFCTQCGMSFTRNEHLERHMLVHDKRKPYRCQVCFIAFTRRDVLQRHLGIHNDSSTPLRRGRGARTQSACTNCARVKVRCEMNTPCKRCVRKNITCERRAVATAKAQDSSHQPPADVRTDDSQKSPSISCSDGSTTVGSVDTEPCVLSEVPNTLVQCESTGLSGDLVTDMDMAGCAELGSLQDGPFLQLEPVTTNFADDMFPLVQNFQEWIPEEDSIAFVDLQQYTTPLVIDAFLADNFITSNYNTGKTCQQNPQDEQTIIDESAIVLAQRFWTAFTCTRSPDFSTCPKTAATLLRRLRDPPSKILISDSCGDSDAVSHSIASATFSTLFGGPGQDLMARIQLSMSKALQLHQITVEDSPSYDLSWLIDPSLKLVEHFISHCQSQLQQYNLSILCLKVGDTALSDVELRAGKALLLLSMLGLASVCCCCEISKFLNGGLTEVCRRALFELLETDVTRCADVQLLHSALMFMIQGSWSGEKWLTDIAVGQRGIYTAAFRHSGLLDLKRHRLDGVLQSEKTSLEFSESVDEVRIRSIYAWMLVEQEVCLFRDQTCLISTNDMNTSLPQDGSLAVYSDDEKRQRHIFMPSISLSELFDIFQSRDTIWDFVPRTWFVVRLLLLPIQEVVANFRKLRSLQHKGECSLNSASRQIYVSETAFLLQKWLELSKQLPSGERKDRSDSIRTTMVLYHCIALNLFCNIPKIEVVARSELPDRITLSNTQLATQCIQDRSQTIWHAQEIIRSLHTISASEQPLWWPAAVYRASLSLWACSLFHQNLGNSVEKPSKALSDQHGIDDDIRYSGVQSLLYAESSADIAGAQVSLEDDIGLLEACLKFLESGRPTRFARGMVRRIQEFLDRRKYLKAL